MSDSNMPKFWKNGNYIRQVFFDNIVNGVRHHYTKTIGKIFDAAKNIYKGKYFDLFTIDKSNGSIIRIKEDEYLKNCEFNAEETSVTKGSLDISSGLSSNNQLEPTQKFEMDDKKSVDPQSEINNQENPDHRVEKDSKSDNVQQSTIVDNKGSKQDDMHTMTFGAEFALIEVMRINKISDVINKIFPNKEDADTLSVLIISSLINVGSARHIKEYYDHSIMSLYYPNAKVTSQDISRFYEKMGSASVETRLLNEHIDYLFNKCGLGKDFNFDSTGLLYQAKSVLEVDDWNHDGDTGHGIRLGLVDHVIGMPIVPLILNGNVHDATTLKPMYRMMDSLGVVPEIIRIDNAFVSDSGLECCYDKNNNLIMDFLSRLKKNSKYLTSYLTNGIDFVKQRDNRFFYNYRELYITSREIFIGENSDKKAHIYIIYDVDRAYTEYSKLKKLYLDGEISEDEYDQKCKTAGIFCLISGKKHGNDEIMHEYLKRVGIEKTIKISKNDLNLLPLSVHNNSILYGKINVGFYSLVVLRVMQFMLKELDLDKVTFFKMLSNQIGHIRGDYINIENRIPQVNAAYEKLGIILPTEIKMESDGKLTYNRADIPNIPKWVTIAVQKQPYTSGPSKKVVEKKKTTTKKDTVSTKDKQAKDDLQYLRSHKKLKPGRPLGSRNEKTKKREELVHTLNEILRIKREDAGVSDEDLKMMEEESDKKNSHFHGRKKGSKNKSTERMELLKQQASRFIDALAEKFSITRTDIINLIVYQSTCPPTPEHNGRGRPKGTLNAATVEKKAIQCLIESSLNSYLEHCDIHSVSTEDLKSLASEITLNSPKESKSLSEHAQDASMNTRGRHKGGKNASTLAKEANMEKAYRWLDEFSSNHSMSREDVITRLWMMNKHLIIPEVNTSENHNRGRRKGDFKYKRIETEVIKFIISSVITGEIDNIQFSGINNL